MSNHGFIKTVLLFCIGLSVCGIAQAEYKYQTSCPWVLAEDFSRDGRKIQAYIEKLGTITNSKEVGNFRKQLRDRVAEDEKIVAAGSNHEKYEQAKEEISRYNVFLGKLGQRLYFFFDGEVDLAKNNVKFNRATLRTKNSNVEVAAHKDDGKCYFFQNGDRVFVEDEDMVEINKQFRQLYYTLYFFQGLNDPEYKKYRAMADACLRYISMAKQNNKPENIDGRPMPKPGKLNSLAPKALALAKRSGSYADAIDVVIDADDWTIERNSAGIIQRRKVGAWVIKQMKRNKRAFRCQFAQPYTGNGYGELILYGVGGGQFNIK